METHNIVHAVRTTQHSKTNKRGEAASAIHCLHPTFCPTRLCTHSHKIAPDQRVVDGFLSGQWSTANMSSGSLSMFPSLHLGLWRASHAMPIKPGWLATHLTLHLVYPLFCTHTHTTGVPKVQAEVCDSVCYSSLVLATAGRS